MNSRKVPVKVADNTKSKMADLVLGTKDWLLEIVNIHLLYYTMYIKPILCYINYITHTKYPISYIICVVSYKLQLLGHVLLDGRGMVNMSDAIYSCT